LASRRKERKEIRVWNDIRMSKSEIVMCGHAGLNLGCEQSISVTHQPPQDSCSLCIRIRRGGGGVTEPAFSFRDPVNEMKECRRREG